MAKKQSRRRLSPRTLVISLIVLGGLAFSLYRVIPRQSASVFVVDTPSYGETTVTGQLFKDSAVGDPGNYYLITSDGKPVLLGVQGLDDQLGLTFRVSGTLNPPVGDIKLPVLAVTTMESQ